MKTTRHDTSRGVVVRQCVASCLFATCFLGILSGCADPGQRDADTVSARSQSGVRLVTLDPGHFHAGLIHKYHPDGVDRVVHIYAPRGPELDSHLALIERFNGRVDNPTNWVPDVYVGDDFLERMLDEKPGNVVVLAGNNRYKLNYIEASVDAGLNVLADKPMVISRDGFPRLLRVLDQADRDGLVVWDVMTERYEITSILQRALANDPNVIGELVPGTPDAPGITKESVHHYSKQVAGAPLVRPTWFFDADQEGHAIVDVSTHLVDLILWQLFSDDAVDYADASDGVGIVSARTWPTLLTLAEFEHLTGASAYPDFLRDAVNGDGLLKAPANAEFVFRSRGVYGKVGVRWEYENPGGGDTHYSIIRGTRANLVIRQGEAQAYRPVLYIEPADASVDRGSIQEAVDLRLERMSEQYPGLSLAEGGGGWRVVVPPDLAADHEEHFTAVTNEYLRHLANGSLPAWEATTLRTKYYITTAAYSLSSESLR